MWVPHDGLDDSCVPAHDGALTRRFLVRDLAAGGQPYPAAVGSVAVLVAADGTDGWGSQEGEGERQGCGHWADWLNDAVHGALQ